MKGKLCSISLDLMKLKMLLNPIAALKIHFIFSISSCVSHLGITCVFEYTVYHHMHASHIVSLDSGHPPNRLPPFVSSLFSLHRQLSNEIHKKEMFSTGLWVCITRGFLLKNLRICYLQFMSRDCIPLTFTALENSRDVKKS